MYSSVFDPLKAHLERPKSPRRSEPPSLRRTPREAHTLVFGGERCDDVCCVRIAVLVLRRGIGIAWGRKPRVFFGNESWGLLHDGGNVLQTPAAGGDCPGRRQRGRLGDRSRQHGSRRRRRRRHDGRDRRRSRHRRRHVVGNRRGRLRRRHDDGRDRRRRRRGRDRRRHDGRDRRRRISREELAPRSRRRHGRRRQLHRCGPRRGRRRSWSAPPERCGAAGPPAQASPASRALGGLRRRADRQHVEAVILAFRGRGRRSHCLGRRPRRLSWHRAPRRTPRWLAPTPSRRGRLPCGRGSPRPAPCTHGRWHGRPAPSALRLGASMTLGGARRRRCDGRREALPSAAADPHKLRRRLFLVDPEVMSHKICGNQTCQHAIDGLALVDFIGAFCAWLRICGSVRKGARRGPDVHFRPWIACSRKTRRAPPPSTGRPARRAVAFKRFRSGSRPWSRAVTTNSPGPARRLLLGPRPRPPVTKVLLALGWACWSASRREGQYSPPTACGRTLQKTTRTR